MEVGEMKDKKESQVEVPWVPATPIKPSLQTVSIYSLEQENQPQLPYHNDGAVACSKFVSYMEQNNMQCIGSVTEAAMENVVGENGKASVETISGGTSDFNRMSFCQLMSMQENAASMNLNATQSSNGLVDPFFTLNLPLANNTGMNNSRNTQGTSYIDCQQIDEEKKGPVVGFDTVYTPSEVDSHQQRNINDTDLNQTPQQKQRRRKHRTKVIVEGKPTRTRKPTNKDNVQPKENSTGKRKYVRKKGINKDFTAPEETALMPEFAKKSCRRTLFDEVEREERFVGRANAIGHPHKEDEIGEKMNVALAFGFVTSMKEVSSNYMSLPEETQVPSTKKTRKGAKPKESQPVKRKYTRKRTSDNESVPGPEEGTTNLTIETKLEPTKMHHQSPSDGDRGDKDVSNNNMLLPEDAQGPLQSRSSNNMLLPEEVQDPLQSSLFEAQPTERTNKRRGGRRKKMNKSCSAGTTEESSEPMILGPITRTRRHKKSREESSTNGENSNACISKENNMKNEEMFVSDQSPSTQQGLKDFHISLPIDPKAQDSSSKDNSIEAKPREQSKGRTDHRRNTASKASTPAATCHQNINMNQACVTFMYDQNSYLNSVSYNHMLADNTRALNSFLVQRNFHKTTCNINCNFEEDGNNRNSGPSSHMVGSERRPFVSPKHAETGVMNIIGAQYNGLPSYGAKYGHSSIIQNKKENETGSTSTSFSKEILAFPQHDQRLSNASSSNVIANSENDEFIKFKNITSTLRSPKDSTTGNCITLSMIQNCPLVNYQPALNKPLGILDAVDAIAKQFRDLNINTQENALIPYKQKKRKQKRDGTIIPFENPFVPIKKQYPRPRVNLDEETERVWNLLMLDINSHGIDGTDEEKVKWWEEERNVFRGRADSFIARMHLVQGDRRFSQWKGSVLDSVVGVFLTQNVSDHLSSEDYTSLLVKEESTKCDAKELDQSIHDRSWITIEVEHSGEKEVVNGNHACKTTSCVSSLTDESVLQELSPRKNEEKKEKLCYEHVSTELNDIVSSQSSVISYPIFGDLSNDRNHEKIGSWSGSNSDVEDLSSTTKYNNTSLSTHLENEKLTDASPINPWEQSNCTSQSLFNVSEQTQDPLQKERQSDLGAHKNAARNGTNEISSKPIKLDSKGKGKKKKDEFNWDSLRIEAQAKAGKRERTENTMDSLDWDAVRSADVSVIANIIKERGMNNRLAERIQNFLNRLVEEHGDIDLEWLRDVPPDKAKEFLLSVRGLGLKSVECVRLLTLHHLAFPVDTNVGRIAVRLGWVPLQPLPESLQLHLVELYPILETIQKYLWPRLCKLDQKTLYELHYQMITFGKVFCTKTKPNCNACPMRGECRHFASAFASARLALPGPEQKGMVSTTGNTSNNATDENPTVDENPTGSISQLHLPLLENANQGAEILQAEVARQVESISEINVCHPIIEEPKTPEPECSHVSIPDIEDFPFREESCEIPTIKLNMEQFTQNLQNYMQGNMELQEAEMSKALVALTPEAANIPMPKLKNVSRLRTEHWVYELPDTHPLLKGWDKREKSDPGKYLLAIWTPGETENSVQPPESKCSSQESGQLCNEKECLSCNSVREARSQTVRGTILIPCRTAMRGRFPLNGTYFQVNEVFADHESSKDPISVQRDLIWNLNRRTVFFGTSVTSIFRGLSTPEIQRCFWRGYVCVRGFERATGAPRPLIARLHFPPSKMPKTPGTTRKRSTPRKPKGASSTTTKAKGASSTTPKPKGASSTTPRPKGASSTTRKPKGAKTKPEQPEQVSDSNNIQKGEENPK
ncbi:hypothetical protein PIB30_048508 [Stylosanthes scabra]|uniref:HhH-GPD domain-containing protein n=1 Tax=Stylosanthes scabra TaxID=79078 RepID=A0ABU6UGF2_9FABA|nr:hypothetical protein [Stylosanthes scabra]